MGVQPGASVSYSDVFRGGQRKPQEVSRSIDQAFLIYSAVVDRLHRSAAIAV